MNIGSQTGSLVNHLLSRSVNGQPVAEVGMGATLLAWTDRYPATIIEVLNEGKMVRVQEDSAVRVDVNGMSESQTYEFTANPAGRVVTFRQRANGMWQEVFFNAETKRWNKVDGLGLRIGSRAKYYDFSF